MPAEDNEQDKFISPRAFGMGTFYLPKVILGVLGGVKNADGKEEKGGSESTRGIRQS
jgi:hypothetical protein